MASGSILSVSQGMLTLFETCPRRFQHTYLDELGLRALDWEDPQQQVGKQFHQLMQQEWLGLDISALLAGSPVLARRFQSYREHPPVLIQGQVLTEHRRTVLDAGFLLVGIYDLLILGDNQAQIVDWKSYAQPRKGDRLQETWQSRLYPYLLARTSGYSPAQISMTYWFAEPSSAGSHSVTFAYSQARHTQVQSQLSDCLTRLTQAMTDYQQGIDFPQVPVSAGHCYSRWEQCPYGRRCDRLGPGGGDRLPHSEPTMISDPRLEELLDLDGIPEILL
jgi:hypothetical protein